MKVLVVDDSKTMRMIVIRQLRQIGMSGLEITEAENGLEGLKALGQDSFDLVLSDWNMPEMTGIEFLRSARAQGFEVSFGFVTSEGSTAMREQADAAGAQFLIAKPFTPESFTDALATIQGVEL